VGLIHTIEHDRLSLFQSAVEDLVRRRGGTAARVTTADPAVKAAAVFAAMKASGEPVPEAPPPEVAAVQGGATAWRCVRLAGELFLARAAGDHDRAQQLESELRDSECDPGWVETVTAYLDYFGPDGRKHPIPYVRFRGMGDFVYDVLPPEAKVVLLGDWGTGMPEAVQLLQQIAGHQPDALVHLGDIYYAGTDHETQQHFISILDRVLDRDRTRVLVYVMPGNHEMYSGGAAFYGMLPKLNAPPRFEASATQQASYFSLRSKDGAWQLLAMDTGYHDHDPFEVTSGMTYVEPDELHWHLDKLQRFAAQGGRTILLSHHQLFSAFGQIGRTGTKPPAQAAYNTNLLGAFRVPLEAGQAAAWFWGHEHNLEIYAPYGPLAKGRCIGHGAVPVFTSQQPYKVLPGLADPPRLLRDAAGHEVQLGTNKDGIFDIGYVLLTLRPDRTAEAAYHVRGRDTPVYVESLP
jgi:hypothetical protein